MFSAAECQAQASELQQTAEAVADRHLRARMLDLAEQWLDLAQIAEMQDAIMSAGKDK